MAGVSKREILLEDLDHMDEAMERVERTKGDIWQDACIWWMAKAIRDILQHVIGGMRR